MSFWEAIKRANRVAKKESFWWLIINLILLIVPIGSAYLIALQNSGHVNFSEPILHGELSLFSLSLLGSGVFVISKGLKITGKDQILRDKGSSYTNKIWQILDNIGFPGSGSFFILLFLESVFAMIIFMTSFGQEVTSPNYEQFSNLHITLSIIVMGLSLLTTFFITLAESSISNSPPDVRELFSRGENDYQKKMSAEDWES